MGERTRDLIPTNTDVLLTHAPPFGIMDSETSGHVGCEMTLRTVLDRVQPILHVFGHVHGERGVRKLKTNEGEIMFVNAAIKGGRSGMRLPIRINVKLSLT